MKYAALTLLVVLAGCQKEGASAGPGGKGPVAFPVEVAAVQARNVEYALSAVGSVEAYETVQITARVAGAVDAVRFAEGQAVKAGEPLVDIDPTRFSLAVRAARASLERATAALAEAEAGLQRREAAVAGAPGLITAEELALYRTRAATAAAEASGAQVALERAQVDLRDAYVKAPVGGVLQSRSVQTGQYVQPGTVLATMVRKDPVLVRFKVPEVDAQRLTTGLAVRFHAGGEAKAMGARITLVSAAADAQSRMVSVTAEVDEADRARARPGAFAEVTAPVAGSRSAPVVPQTAVRPSERGFLAYVVEGGVAKERVLTLGLRTDDGQIEVKSGLTPGEQLVVRGAEALRDGAQVRPVESLSPPAVTGGPPAGPGGSR